MNQWNLIGTVIAGGALLAFTWISDVANYTRYTTTGDKNVRARAAELTKIIAVSGTSVTAVVWDTAAGACNTGTQVTGALSLTNGTPVELNVQLNSGLCITLGGTSPDVTVLSR